MVGNCQKCTLNPAYYVPDEGPDKVDVAFVGEAPGSVELQRGRPFVGRAGELLDRLLAEVGIDRKACFIGNACTCRPIPHRAPRAVDIAACRARLLQALKDRRPRVVVALGAVPMRALLPGTRSLKQARGLVVYSEEIGAYVLPTYHPAGVLRSPELYATVLRDLRKVPQLVADPVAALAKPEVQYLVVEDQEHFDALLERLESVYDVALDVETASDGSLLCVGLSWRAGTAAVVTRATLDIPRLAAALRHKNLIAHNAKFDLQALWRAGAAGLGTGEDTMLLSYVLDERSYVEAERRGVHGLKYLAREVLNADDYSRDVAPYYDCMEKAPPETLYRYNAHDAAYTLMLAEVFRRRLGTDEQRVLRELLYPASDALARMEYAGIRADRKYLTCLDYVYSERVQQAKRGLYALAGREFNPNSPKQVVQILYRELQLPMPGPVSSNKNALKALSSLHPFPRTMLEYRGVVKLHSTYVEGIAGLLDANDRIHTSFNLAITVTGRLCVGRDTFVEAPRDLVKYPKGIPVYELKPGDWVYSFTWDKRLCLRRVRWVGKTGDKPVVIVRVKDEFTQKETTLKLTEDHLVRLYRGEWLPAGMLKPGMRLLGMMRYGVVVSVEPGGVEEVWDLEVEDTHTFIGNGVALHNSSSRPNLQNVARNPEIRNIFVGTPGYTLVEADLSQAEIRAACLLARDEKLRETLLHEDVHVRTAALMFGVPPGDVTPEMRTAAKRISFGVLYGMGAATLAQELKVSVAEAEMSIRKFFEAFPRVQEWMDELKQEVLNTGSLRTPFGRVRHFDLITDENRETVLRESVNFPVQSTASDVTLSALIRLDQRIQRGELGDTRLLLVVHDSVLLETAEDAAAVAEEVRREMERPVLDGWVPFTADVKTGQRWGALYDRH